ncbi:MAG: C-terminal glycine zipper region [Verrucomicrobia bacterium]|jgi:ElaB/YqjD/DUF883 family membrane-anchored ribosome-binding protein|nr:C-terminal glycine zipper region [Verrucomicrobiota bacterium]
MKKHTAAVSHDLETLADDARALLAATADVAEEKVVAARKRVEDALENVHDQALAGVKAADKTIRTHPYESIGIALGVGALIGYLLGRRN